MVYYYYVSLVRQSSFRHDQSAPFPPIIMFPLVAKIGPKSFHIKAVSEH